MSGAKTAATVTRPLAILLFAAVFALSAAAPARAVSLLRDADIEYALGALAQPVLQAAGLSPSQVQIVLVHDSSLNAFIVDPTAIYIHSGLILKLESPEAQIGRAHV